MQVLRIDKSRGAGKKQWMAVRYSRYQRAISASFVILFALLLPFICFGAIGEPGHPHLFPHFVFAEPILADAEIEVNTSLNKPLDLPSTKTETATSHSASDTEQFISDHHEAGHNGLAHNKLSPLTEVSSPQSRQPVGRSIPSLILFSILMLASLCAWVLSRIEQRQVINLFPQRFPESIVLAIPLPPPRTSIPSL